MSVTAKTVLLRALEEAADAHGEIAIDRVAFAEFVAMKIDAGAIPDLARVHVVDLLLAFASAEGSDTATTAIDALLGPIAARVHASVATGLDLDELTQRLRVHLLVPAPGERKRILSFAGQSSLTRWLHVVATRFALNTRRGERVEVPFEDAFFLSQPDLSTPEVRLLDARYSVPIREAIGRSLARLDAREQAILWMSLVDGQPAERIGQVYGVHRTTASRWITNAVAALREGLEEELAEDEGLRASQLSSLVRSILSSERAL